MQIKSNQLQVAAGFVCAFALGLAQHRASPLLLGGLQSAAILLCAAGIFNASQALRQRYAALGADQSLAIGDANYMAERLRFQVTAMFATSAFFMVLASRYDTNVLLTGLIVLIVGVGAIPLINRLRGWVRSR